MGDHYETEKSLRRKLPPIIIFMTILTSSSIQDIASDRLNILRILAVVFLLLFLWRYLRESPAQKEPQLVSPLESRWREDIGNKIKDTKEVAATCLFLILSFYVGYNAFYFSLVAYAVMRLIEYFLLESRVQILENVFAFAMIAGFFVVIILWAASDFFSPVLAALFLLAFCFAFIMIFWIYGYDWFLYRVRRALGKKRK